jgi:hemerythrin
LPEGGPAEYWSGRPYAGCTPGRDDMESRGLCPGPRSAELALGDVGAMTHKLSPELVSGFEEIDGQHGVLFQRLEAALAAVRADSLPATKHALQTLGDYLLAHFAEEEKLMAAATYPDRGRHKSAHDLFMQDFVQLTRELDVTGLSVPVVEWIAARVPEWIKFHIQVNDIPLSRFLATRRPKDVPAIQAAKHRAR